MKTYSVKCTKNTENLNTKIFKTKNGRLIMQSKCTECRFKKSRFMKEQQAIFFLKVYKINEIVNKFLLLGDTFMPEINLKQPGFTYSAFGPFTRNKKHLCKQKIQILFTEMILIRLVFNML